MPRNFDCAELSALLSRRFPGAQVQAEPICVINAERACAALDDLDAWASLN